MELWDVYDKDGNRTGRTHDRAEPLAPGDYHLAVTVVIVNSRKEVLCTLRSREKSVFPGVWENPGGGVLAGETSIQGALRELSEETGVMAAEEELHFLCRRMAANPKGEGFFMDVYGLKRDLLPEELTLQPGEVDGAKWFPIDEWEQKARAEEILAGAYTDQFFASVRALGEDPSVELLDIYDASGGLTSRFHRRGTDLRPGEFCLATAVVIYNGAGQILCTLRSPEKKVLPNTWESPGGSVLAGESSVAGALRELWEETGIAANPKELQFILRVKGSFQDGGELLDLYALRRDIPASGVKCRPGETVDARWFPIDEWEEKVRAGEIWAGENTEEFFGLVRRLAAPKEREVF